MELSSWNQLPEVDQDMESASTEFAGRALHETDGSEDHFLPAHVLLWTDDLADENGYWPGPSAHH